MPGPDTTIRIQVDSVRDSTPLSQPAAVALATGPTDWGAHHYMALDMANQPLMVQFFYSMEEGPITGDTGHIILHPTPPYASK